MPDCCTKVFFSLCAPSLLLLEANSQLCLAMRLVSDAFFDS